MADDTDLGKAAPDQAPEGHEPPPPPAPVALTEAQLETVSGGRLPNEFRKPTSPFD